MIIPHLHVHYLHIAAPAFASKQRADVPSKIAVSLQRRAKLRPGRIVGTRDRILNQPDTKCLFVPERDVADVVRVDPEVAVDAVGSVGREGARIINPDFRPQPICQCLLDTCVGQQPDEICPRCRRTRNGPSALAAALPPCLDRCPA